MLIEYSDGTGIIECPVFVSLENAREAITNGATNGLELLEEAGLSPDEAAAELDRLLNRPR